MRGKEREEMKREGQRDKMRRNGESRKKWE